MNIWKFPIEVTDEQIVEMPSGAQILCVQTQHNQPCIWAIVDASHIHTTRIIKTYGTGHPFDNDDSFSYLGTYQLNNGGFVGHVFINKESI